MCFDVNEVSLINVLCQLLINLVLQKQNRTTSINQKEQINKNKSNSLTGKRALI